MKRRMYSGVIGIILVISILAAEMPLVVFANKNSDDSGKIKESQEAISDAQEQKTKLQSGLNDVTKILKGLESQKNNLEGYVTELDTNLTEIQEKLDDLNDAIDEKQKELDQTKLNLEKAKKNEEIQYAAMKQRIRFMYEKRDNTYLDVILSAKGFGDLLNKTEYVSNLAEYDNIQLEKLIETKNQVIELEKKLQSENEELQDIRQQVKEDEAAVETLISAKKDEIETYDADIGNKEQMVKAYQQQIADQDATIKSLEAAIEEERKRLAASNQTVATYDGGQFTFPCPNYTRVSDDYGNRIHPTLGVQQFHNGVDLAAPSGSPILAAYNGTVIAAAYSSTMGNYIMIDHGDGLFTIYMHASSLLVSSGDSVSAGQKIALVGSTGRSTGPHLHFSVRLNGSYVSPWNYLK